MGKRVFIIHGWDGHPNEGWRPWLRDKLVEKGFDVVVPAMPASATPTLDKWLPFLIDLVKDPDENTYFVGHSLGCVTILKFLEMLEDGKKIGGAILVAGFGKDLEYEGYNSELKSFFEKPIDWENIKKHCCKFVAIHSSDDPWVNINNNKLFADELGAKCIIVDNMKHFSGDDGINELQVVLDEMKKISNG